MHLNIVIKIATFQIKLNLEVFTGLQNLNPNLLNSSSIPTEQIRSQTSVIPAVLRNWGSGLSGYNLFRVIFPIIRYKDY